MKFSYDPNYFPPMPSVTIWLGVPDESLTIGPLSACVDTGADIASIPFQHIRLLKVQVDNRKYLRSQWGERRLVDICFLDMGIGNMRLPFVEIVADDWSEEVILGRNVLNKLIMTLNRPKQLLEILD